MQTALRSRLLADATVSGMIGTRADWGLRPQGKALPALSLFLDQTPRAYHMGGAQNTQHHFIQVESWGATYKASKELNDAAIACLEPATGNFLAGFVEWTVGPKAVQTEVGQVFYTVSEFKITHISA